MVKLFIINLLRCLVCSVIVSGVSVLLSWIICLFYEPMSVWYYYLFGAIAGGIIGFIACCVYGYRSASNDDRYFREDKVLTVKVIIPLLFVSLLVVPAIGCFIAYKDILSDMIKNSEEWHTDFGVLTTALGAFSIIPIMFVFAFIISYGSSMCMKCGHIFCIDESMESSGSREYSQYKTETNREQIGSITADNTEIAKVYGNVSSSYYRNVRETTTHYKCICRICGHRFKRVKVEKTHGDWK